MVEILLATYNGELYLREQLDSILAQSVKDWKLIISDDGSTDATLDIINEYIKAHEDRISLLKNETTSGSAKNNFLRLLSHASEDYVMFCDQDDVWETNKIELSLNCIAMLERKYGKEKPLMVHSDLEVVSDDMTSISPSFLELMKLPIKKGIGSLIVQNSVVGCTIMMNSAMAEMGKKIDFEAPILMHDHALAIIAAAYGHIALIKTPTVKYRQHEGNVIGAAEGVNKYLILKRLKSGRKRFQNEMLASYTQVGYIISLFGDEFVNPKYKEILCGYSDLGEKKKIERIIFYIKYRIYKKSIVKKIVQLMWA